MSYSIIGLLALIINLIINRESLKIVRERENERRAVSRYRHFLAAANCYFVTDILWGFLYERRELEAVFPFLFLDCELYFLFMFLTMTAWVRYVLSYWNQGGLRGKILLGAVWSMFALALVCLAINFFHPCIFSFDERRDYVTAPGRHIAFVLQIVLYVAASIYTLYAGRKLIGGQKSRHVAVGLTCLVMEFFSVWQILQPQYPIYAMGLAVGICVIHSFVEARERKEKEMYENTRREDQKKRVTFTQIAEALAANYDLIYYVDAKDASYISYECRNIYGKLDVQKSGDDYFADSKNDISNVVHKGDRDLVGDFLDKDHLASVLENQKNCSLDYRIVMSKKTHYVRMTVQKTDDGSHYIIGVENIDEEIKREKQHLKALNTEKELARRDELTGVKNKTAYNELERSVQANIDNGMDYLPFGLVVCDANNLKVINDTEGHAAGDEYIKKSAQLLCNTFVHSPVFRIGGDEFVVFLRGSDYANKESLMKSLRAQVLENQRSGFGPVLASGMAEYLPKKDTLVAEIFDRADKEMYKNKRTIKAG